MNRQTSAGELRHHHHHQQQHQQHYLAAIMDSLITEVKPMRIPRPKFCCAKSSFMYPVEPPKDYLDLEGDHHVLLQQPHEQLKSGSDGKHSE
ncbi:uncharacterized protein LOC135111199 [Scylla paramamosain]|uniref:uncharacterized protein LOC135111199 n=1 Tax=Scylla paramamosain TaxID=85552 RepID=UPI0030833597